MADFTFVINPRIDDEPDIVAQEQDIVAFRVYERLSGMDPSLDEEKKDLRRRAPEDDSPESPFDIRGMRHAPPVLNHQETVQPPYYVRVLLSPSVITQVEDVSDLLGRSARLTVTDNLGAHRHVRGLILRAMNRTGPFGRSNVVELQIYPTLWATAISEKSRVWRDIDSISVMRQVLAEYREELGEIPAVIDQALNGRPPLRECVVQWAESDFAFVSRLLERDGIYYFFTHEEKQIKLHLADMRTPYSEGFVPHRSLALEATLGPGSELFDDHASFLCQNVQTTPRSYRVADYNPATADTVLDYSAPSEGESALEVYDYPGEFASLGTAPTVAGRRYTAVSARRSVVTGASRCPFLTAGHSVTLPPFKNDGEDKPFRILEVVHELVRDDAGKPFYRNWFEALDGDTAYAPIQRTPVPAAHGTHNATVVSALPEETVDVDEYSRALVLFRWDPGFAPVRARLGQPWAGGKHGVNVLPRAGDEVLVGFIQGNTERPVILTALHNSATPKKHNPTQMEERDLEGQANKGPQRQNRYTTAIHNTQGNALYLNDTSGHELVKIDAYKNFVLEVGHKVENSPQSSTGGVFGIQIDQPGLGYLSPPPVTIDGGDGNAEASTGIDDEGRVVRVTITDPGSGYTTSDASVSVGAPPKDNGSITSITLITQGQGYLNGNDEPIVPNVTVDSQKGKNAALQAIVDDSGKLTGIDVITGGAGYRSSDPVTIEEPPGNASPRTLPVAEVGQVQSHDAALSVSQINIVGTADALDQPDASDENQNEPNAANFVSKKEDRGSALIRTYGDLTLYVGKYRKTGKEYAAGSHNQEKIDFPGKEFNIDQGERGTFSTYVMGGTTHVVRGSFAFVTHPAEGYLIEAEYKSADYYSEVVASTIGQSHSSSAHHGVSSDLGLGSAYAHSEGFNASCNLNGSFGVGAGINASSSASIDFELHPSNFSVKMPFFTQELKCGLSDELSSVTSRSENPGAVATGKGYLLAINIALGIFNAALFLTGSVIKYRAAVFTDDDYGDMGDKEYTAAETDVKEFLKTDLPKISKNLHIVSGVAYILHLLAGLGWVLARAGLLPLDVMFTSKKTSSVAGEFTSNGPSNTELLNALAAVDQRLTSLDNVGAKQINDATTQN